MAVTDTDGGIAAAYAYTPFGLLAGQSGVLQNNPFTFVGAYGVMDEGNGLYYMKNRYYDANTGRFIQKDPLGTTASLNLYGYVGDNPLNRIDPLGLIDAGDVAVTSNYGIALWTTYAAVTGIISGGSIPMATLGLVMVAGRLYSTATQTKYNDPNYKPSNIPADLVDPTGFARSLIPSSWQVVGEGPWGAPKVDYALSASPSCPGVRTWPR
jgi:RHS repeat-associated protein